MKKNSALSVEEWRRQIISVYRADDAQLSASTDGWYRKSKMGQNDRPVA
jgi:hypothetical protein